MDGAIVMNGHWGLKRRKCCIINVYAPCPLSERIALWDRFNLVIQQNGDCCLCIAGNFNSIRKANERVGQGETINHRDLGAFDEFNREVDLPLVGKKFTYYRTDCS